MHEIPWSELRNDQHYPTYKIGHATHMVSKVWGSTRVRIRNFHPDLILLQQEEIKILRNLTHPNIILLMGITHSPPVNNPVLVFEHIQFGTLYSWLHTQKKSCALIVCLDILLQVTDAVLFLHSRGYIHRALSSHAVQLASPFIAKLARFEYTIRQDCNEIPKVDYATENFVNWIQPEVLAGGRPTIQSDVYSLCALTWETFMGKIPWGETTGEEIINQVVKNGSRLPLDKKLLPGYLYNLLDVGLRQDTEVLDIEEVRDMLLITRSKAEEHIAESHSDTKTGSNALSGSSTRSTPNRTIPHKQPTRNSKRKLTRSLGTRSTGVLSTKIQPSDLSRSLIQLGPYGFGRYVEDYSFVSDPAKREFLLSSPYDDGTGSAFSFGDGVDISSGESSPELRAIASSSDSCDSSHNYRKSSDSGIHIQPHHTSDESSPQSMIKLTGFLAGSQSIANIGRLGTRRSRLYESMRARRSATSPRGGTGTFVGSCHQDGPMRRHGSLPRTRVSSGRADYETGIKPASHRTTANDFRGETGVSPATTSSPSPLPVPPVTTALAGLANGKQKRTDSASCVQDGSELYTTALESPGKPRGPTGKARNTEALKWAMGPPSRTGGANGAVQPVQAISRPPAGPTTKPATTTTCSAASTYKQSDTSSVPNNIASQNQDKRNAEEASSKCAESSDSPPRKALNIGHSGVQGIVSSLESCKTPYTSPPMDVPSQPQTVFRTISESKNRTNSARPKSLYCEPDNCPAEKVADILKRNLPRHDSTRFKQDRNELVERLKRRDRLSCNLEDQKSVQLVKQAMLEQAANNVAVAVEVTESKADDNANDIPKHGHVDAAKKALKGTTSLVGSGQVDSRSKEMSGDRGKELVRSPTQPQIHTARIYQPQTSKPVLSRARTSTPIEIKHNKKILQNPGSMQLAFHTALDEAAHENNISENNNNVNNTTNDKFQSAFGDVESANNVIKNASETRTVGGNDLVNGTSDKKFELGKVPVSAPSAISRNPDENASIFSRESYVTVVESESGPHSILQTQGFDEINEDGDVGQGGQQTPVQLRKQSNVTFSSKVDEITRSNTNNQHSNNNDESGSVFDTAPVNFKRNRFSAYSSGRSSMSGCSVFETEDIYFDEELHPSLENDPNMQLLTTAMLMREQRALEELQDADACIFQSMDRESVLSMEIPSTGPQSLRSEYATDIEQQDLEESYRGHLSSYHTPSTTQQQHSAIQNHNNNSDQASNHSEDSETHKNISSCHSDSSSVEDISMWPSESADLTKTPSPVNGSIPTPPDGQIEQPIHSSTLV